MYVRMCNDCSVHNVQVTALCTGAYAIQHPTTQCMPVGPQSSPHVHFLFIVGGDGTDIHGGILPFPLSWGGGGPGLLGNRWRGSRFGLGVGQRGGHGINNNGSMEDINTRIHTYIHSIHSGCNHFR